MKTLEGYYKAYADWLDNGATPYRPFSRGVGLCSNLRYYTGADNILILTRLERQLADQFEDAGLSAAYPFGEEAFDLCLDQNNMHLDPNRIAWVKSHLEKGENQ